MRIEPALPAAPEVSTARRVTESFAVFAKKLFVRTAVADSPTVTASVAASMLRVLPTVAADEGTTESIPKPKAAIAVKAIRLKNVFFDIDFLSIVVKKTFFSTAGKDLTFAS
jgi:hypothetical protein